MKVLVTGGAGFIGRYTVKRLIDQGDQVVVVDSLEGNRLPNFEKSVTFYQADITSESNKLESIFAQERPEYVIHLAAQISVRYSLLNPSDDAESNIMGTIHVLNQCVRYGVKKVVFSSSAAAYGNPRQVPVQESHETEPLSFYGVSKRVSEIYIQSFAHHYGLDYSILRYANAYGIRETRNGEDGVISAFVERIMAGLPLDIYGDGRQTRDFVYVKDIAEANVAALRGGSGQIMNVSSGKGISLLEIVEILKSLCGKNAILKFWPQQSGDIEHSVLDNGKAKDLLWWTPIYSLIEGLQEIVNFEMETKKKALSITNSEFNKISTM